MRHLARWVRACPPAHGFLPNVMAYPYGSFLTLSFSSQPHRVDVVVIGAGQAGLAMAYELRKRGFVGYVGSEEVRGRSYLVLDAENRPGGAWQHRWPSLSMASVNHIADLPHFPAGEIDPSARASDWVGTYFGDFEDAFDLPILRPVMVTGVFENDDESSLNIQTTAGTFNADVIVNATGAWTRPFIPHYPGVETFAECSSTRRASRRRASWRASALWWLAEALVRSTTSMI